MIFPKTKTKCVDLLNYKDAVALGCYSDGGKIFPALSASAAKGALPDGVTSAAYSGATKMFFLCADKKLHGSSSGTIFLKLADTDVDEPTVFDDYGEYGLATYVLGDKNYLVYRDDRFTVKPVNSGICGGVLKNGRLFGIDKEDGYTVRWSGADGAMDWRESIDGAGWIKLCGARGRILNLVLFGEKLIAVREKGLTVISAFGTPENYKVEATDTDTPEIYKNTAAVVGGKLVFCAGNGVYAYDGGKISRLNFLRQNELISPSSATAFGDKYFACGYSKALERKAVFVLDTHRESRFLIDAAAETLVAGDKVLCLTNGGAVTLEEGGSFSYICGALNFDTLERKTLTSLEIDCGGSAEITVESEGKMRGFSADKRRLRVDMRGVTFKITVKAEAEIRALKAYAEVTGGV